MDYVALWEAAAPYCVFDDDEREHCDALIASGAVSPDAILAGLKTMVRLVLTAKFGLVHRVYEPVQAQYLAHVH